MGLIIVESPTKARTFNRFLKGKDYFVYATMGHIRDLPENELAIDYQNNFLPKYQIIKNKHKIVDALKKLALKNNEIIIATDMDREGESIGYHAAYIFGFVKENWPDFEIVSNKNHLKRIIFHEITPKAIEEALANPTLIRTNLVKAQQARRILDRIVGYELSPLLWKKTGKNWLSAGRVQTVALRIIVEREKEIENFPIEEYFEISGLFQFDKNDSEENLIKAKLLAKNGQSYYLKKKVSLFTGDYTYSLTTISKELVEKIKIDLQNDTFYIKEINKKTEKRYPPPPFTTSILQQEAFSHYGFSSKLTMKLAQDLYESGLITYHRTDSFNLNSNFIFKTRDFIKKKYGENYLSNSPRNYKTKSKLAQEAHEAIRPTKLTSITKFTSVNHKKLYQLIFNRTIATQMKEAEYDVYEFKINSQKGYEFQSVIKNLIFDGFLKVLNPNIKENQKKIFKFEENDKLFLKEVYEEKKQTQPPDRYNEGSLIKVLEEKGIGRPSTYANIISLIQDKHYVEKRNRYFVPTQLGRSICEYLANSFSKIFDLNFTAKMEESLDDIANGNQDLLKVLRDFYSPFRNTLMEEKDNISIINVEEKIHEKCPLCGADLLIRYSKYGKFIACSNYPQCQYHRQFKNFVDNYYCPLCHGRVIVKYTKNKKKFFGCENYPKCKWSSWRLNEAKKEAGSNS